MMSKNRKGEGEFMIIGGVAIIILIVLLLAWGIPTYNVWSSEMAGKAELRQADWNRQIAIKEAEANLESEKLNAKSEVERAKGLAQANEIIGESLKGNSEYITYLYVQMMKNTNNQVIYVPTESSIPILEAGRLEKNE